MDPYRSYREPGNGHSSSRSGGYQTRDVHPDSYSSDYSPSRRPSHGSVGGLGSSRFQREYAPPSMSPDRLAKRRAPVGISSFYSRGLDGSRRAPPRPNLSRYGSERHSSPSHRPSTSSRGYGVDLSGYGGGYDGSGYGGMDGEPRCDSSSHRPRDQPDISRDAYGGTTRHHTPAHIFGNPLGSASSRPMSSSHREREYQPSPLSCELSRGSRSANLFHHFDSVTPNGRRDQESHGSRSYRHY